MKKRLAPLTEADASMLGLGMSFNEIRSLLSTTLKELEPSDPDGDGDNDTWIYIYDLYPSPPTVIYENNSCMGDDGPYRMRSFAIDQTARTATFGDPVVVARKTLWLPVATQANESERPDEETLYEAGSRHSKDDAARIQSVHDSATAIVHHTGTLLADGPQMMGAFPQTLLQKDDTPPASESITESATFVEVAETAFGDIREALANPKGEITMTMIRPGFNTSRSRYYPKEALTEAVSKSLLGQGVQMYIDHPTKSEDKEIPERSLTKLAAIISEASIDKDGAVVGKAKIVNPGFRETLAAMQEQGVLGSIGVSINATGRIKEATIDGVKTNLVEGFTSFSSVDFVTKPGAGGRISLMESDPTAPTVEGETHTMDEKTANEIKEAIAGLTTLVTGVATKQSELETRVVAQGVQTQIGALIAGSALPDVGKRQLTARFAEASTIDGVAEAIAEMKELVGSVPAPVVKLKRGGGVQGMGSGATRESAEEGAPAETTMEEFEEAMGVLYGGAEAFREVRSLC